MSTAWIKRFGDSNILFIPKGIDLKLDWLSIDVLLKNYKSLKLSTAHIEFSCFTSGTGKCRDRIKTGSGMCCCSECYHNKGYFDERCDILFESDIPTYNSLFDSELGFWRSGVGCMLPRELRSTTCVCYNCESDDGKREMLYAISDKLKSSANQIRGSIAGILSAHILGIRAPARVKARVPEVVKPGLKRSRKVRKIFK